ncbi:MAG TPA: hypothetical protein VIL36_00600 [Acidimicrobiales bacterium]
MSPVRRQTVEERVRASLHRRAAEIDVEPPPWEEAVGRASGVVVPLRPAEVDRPPAHLRAPRRRGGSRSGRDGWCLHRLSLRPVLATAAALLVVVAAAVVIDTRLGSERTDGEGQAPLSDGGPRQEDRAATLAVPDDLPSIPAPGGTDFRPDQAAALPLDTARPEVLEATGDPTELALLYLLEMGLDDHRLEEHGIQLQVDEFKSDEPTTDPSNGTVWWSTWNVDDGERLANGGVFLRRGQSGTGEAEPAWEIAGASTFETMVLLDVRRGGGTLRFTVNDLTADPAVLVLVDGTEVHEGELRGGNETFTLADPDPDDVVTIEVLHLVRGLRASITAMAVPPEDELVRVGDGTTLPARIPTPTTVRP